MGEDRAREMVQERQKDGKLPCAEAFKIAEESGISRPRLGEILNNMEIKVIACQLGCF
jgi:hypothetical protein